MITGGGRCGAVLFAIAGFAGSTADAGARLNAQQIRSQSIELREPLGLQ